MDKVRARRWLIVPIVLIGVALFVALKANRSAPELAGYAEVARVVRTVQVPMVTVVPRFRGNGNVEPSQIWNGVAQVSGQVVAVDAIFQRGAVVKQGQFLLQIDPTDYELAIRQVETSIEAARAQLSEIEIQETNSKASLKIEQDSLQISVAEMERKRSLAERGTMSSSDFEKEQRNVLGQRQTVQSLENTIRLYPAEGRRLNAELQRLDAQLAVAQHDLERTRISAPFTFRVASADVERYQFIRAGDRIGTGDGIERAEIEVQVPMWRVASLLRSEGVTDLRTAQDLDIGERFGLSAEVVLERDALQARWQGRVARFSDTLDPRTRTIGVIVEVDDPYANIQPGVRPPLLKGLFVAVDITGQPRPDSLVIPRVAMHAGYVHVVGDGGRLEKRKVESGHVGDGFHIVADGLVAGERVVVSDLVPAIEGMLLESRDDPETLERLTRAASGRTSERAAP